MSHEKGLEPIFYTSIESIFQRRLDSVISIISKLPSTQLLEEVKPPQEKKVVTSPPKTPSLVKVKRWERHMQSVVLILFHEKKPNKVLIFKERTNTWGFPAGLVEEGEIPLDTLKREYKEESGWELPKIDYKTYVFTAKKGRTSAIFIAKTRVEVKTQGFGPARQQYPLEVLEMKFVTLEELEEMRDGRLIRKSALESLPLILRNLRKREERVFVKPQ